MEAIPRATRQKGSSHFLASPPALRTQQLVGFRSTPSTPANSTRRLAQGLSSVTPQTKTQPTGAGALFNNGTGGNNTANGTFALFYNLQGGDNTAIGIAALSNNTTGSNNVALGSGAGASATTGSNNVYIGAGMQGVAGESDACYIKSIFGQTSATGIPVLVNSNNKLGTTMSSKRFKKEIRPMDNASDALLALKPVTFRYKEEIDPAGTTQFGLVAEQVETV